jgi:hypothetical protein
MWHWHGTPCAWHVHRNCPSKLSDKGSLENNDRIFHGANTFGAILWYSQIALGGAESNISRALFYFFPLSKQYSTFQPTNHSHSNCSISTTIFQASRSISAPHVPKRSNAIRHLERNDYFQATASVWSYVDRLETSSRVEDVTSSEGPKAFGWRGRFTTGCESLYSVPRTVSASTAGGSRSVIDHAPKLSPLLDVLGRKRESGVWKEEGGRS